MFSDIPQPWRQEFWIALAGRPMARIVDEAIPCAYAYDWLNWVRGNPLEVSGPSGLEDATTLLSEQCHDL